MPHGAMPLEYSSDFVCSHLPHAGFIDCLACVCIHCTHSFPNKIGTNGVFSFGYRETGYWHHINDPTRFYAAPFWGDVNTVQGGDIYYEIHTVPSLLIDQVSSLVSARSGTPFSATWMVVSFWDRVQQYGSFSENVSVHSFIV